MVIPVPASGLFPDASLPAVGLRMGCARGRPDAVGRGGERRSGGAIITNNSSNNSYYINSSKNICSISSSNNSYYTNSNNNSYSINSSNTTINRRAIITTIDYYSAERGRAARLRASSDLAAPLRRCRPRATRACRTGPSHRMSRQGESVGSWHGRGMRWTSAYAVQQRVS